MLNLWEGIYVQVFMPHWNFEYTLYTVVKVGGGMGQGPATEVTS